MAIMDGLKKLFGMGNDAQVKKLQKIADQVLALESKYAALTDEELQQVKDQVKDIYLLNLGPIIGSTIGPDAFTVNFYGKKVEIATEE